MAHEDDRRPAKRQRTDDGSGTVAGLPRKSSTYALLSEMYNPTMIRVIVGPDDEDIDEETGEPFGGKGRENDLKKEFVLPRALICAKSEYFDSLFRGGFEESKTGVVRLRTVQAWEFQVFTGWLYVSKLLYNSKWDEPIKFDVQFDEREKQKEEAQLATELEEQDTIEDNATYNASLEAETQLVDSRETPLEKRNEIVVSSKPNNEALSPQAPSVPAPAQPSHEQSHDAVAPTKPEERTREEPDRLREWRQNEEDATEDDANPVSWSWEDLFYLYIFGDAFPSRGFRIAVLETMQLKVMQTVPRKYLLPSSSEIKLLTDNLPISSGPIRLMVDQWQHLYVDNVERDLEDSEESSAAFYMACFIKCQKRMAAMKCTACTDGSPCLATSHSKDDSYDARHIHPCKYHEHGDDEEEKRFCKYRWEAIANKIVEDEDRVRSEQSEGHEVRED